MTWSPGLLRIYGVAEAHEDGFLSRIHPEDRVRVEANIASFLSVGDTFEHTFRIVRPDGEVRWVNDRGVIERDANGVAVRLRGINIDVTPAAATLKEDPEDRQARLDLALQAGDLGVHDFDPQSGRIHWDAHVRAIWGVGAAEPITYGVFAAGVHPDDLPRVQAAVDRALDPNGSHRFESHYRVINRITRAVHHVRADGVVLFEGGVARRLVGTVRDLTADIERESRLRRQDNWLQRLMDGDRVGFCDIDLAANEPFLVTPSFRSVWGFGPDDPVEFDEIVARTHPDDRDALIEHHRRLAREGGPFEATIRVAPSKLAGPINSTRWLHVMGFAEPGPGDLPSRISAVNIDITSSKETEEALRAAHDTFRQIVERSPFGIYVIDSDFRFAHISDGARPAFASIGPLIGRDFAECTRLIWPEPFATDIITVFRHTLATGEPYHAPRFIEQRADVQAVESYDWKTERITLPDGRFGVVCHFYDLTERQRHEEHVRFLLDELNHRSKNLLSLVQAIARQTARSAPDEFQPRFERRLRALGAAQDLLIAGARDGVPLAELIHSQLAHFGDFARNQISLDGPDVRVQSNAAQAIGMALHELGTNACKYGALSVREGAVAIVWRVETASDGADRFVLEWVEVQGPPVAPPTRRGFGRRVVEEMAARTIGGDVALTFDPAGVRWRLACAAASTLVDAAPGAR